MPEYETRENTYESVTALNSQIRSTVASLGGGVVEAEIRSLNLAASGHCYLTLADADCEIRAVMWKGTVSRQGNLPIEGDLVDAHFDKVDFYPARGSLQIVLSSLEPTGEGALLRRRAETLRRLEAEGLTSDEHKPALARFPKKLGVIAGKDSDAMHDVIQAVRLRSKSVPIVFCPALVQGVQSPMSVAAAIATLCQTEELETIILARGGGSVTDLAGFDNEQLCRAIFASPVPVITSIGHTKDRPVCDYVSAAFAPVPAKAAEFALAVSDEEMLRTLDEVVAPTLAGARSRFVAIAGELDRIENEILVGARRGLNRRAERIDDAHVRLSERAHESIRARRTEVRHQIELLAAADLPSRGAIFATSEDGETLRSTGQLARGEKVNLNFADGTAGATIDNIESQKEAE